MFKKIEENIYFYYIYIENKNNNNNKNDIQLLFSR